jgi:hypothetical protein
VANGETYFSRFFVKFIEISAAGVATAVSGYVLAHLSGYLNAPPAAIQAPAAIQVPAGNPAPAQVAVPQAPAAKPQATASAPAAPPAAAQQPARTAVTTLPAAPLRKSLPNDKPADTANAASAPEGKVRDVTDTKPRSPESIEAEVRAALSKVDAAHPGKPDAKAEIKAEAKPEATPRRAETSPDIAARTPAADSKQRSSDAPTGAIANAPRFDTPPRTADIAPPSAPQPEPQPRLAPQPVAQPVSQPPMQIAPPPPAAVEIKSMPVAGVDSAPQPAAQTDAQVRPDDSGLFSAFRHLPQRLRDDKPLPSDQAPRPPADVGQ